MKTQFNSSLGLFIYCKFVKIILKNRSSRTNIGQINDLAFAFDANRGDTKGGNISISFRWIQ